MKEAQDIEIAVAVTGAEVFVAVSYNDGTKSTTTYRLNNAATSRLSDAPNVASVFMKDSTAQQDASFRHGSQLCFSVNHHADWPCTT